MAMDKSDKIRIFILLISFFGCSWLGYLAAMDIYKIVEPENDNLMVTRTPFDSKQQKVLLIRVNKLDTGTPRMFSVWYAAMSYNDPTRILIKSLYPGNPDDKLAAALGSTFGLNAQGNPNKAFTDALSKYKIKWNAFIIVDTEAVKAISRWATGKEAKVVLKPPDQWNQVSDFLQQDSDTLMNVCRELIPQDNEQKQRTLDWQSILSTHMQVSYGLEAGLVNWSRLISAHSTMCKVIISQ